MEYRGEYTVVRTDEPVTMGAECQCGSRGTNSRVDHGEVDRTPGITMPGPAEKIRRGSDVSGIHAVAEINEDCGGGTAENYSLHLSDIGVADSKVGEQGDDGQSPLSS
jgi:hypothetical protein